METKGDVEDILRKVYVCWNDELHPAENTKEAKLALLKVVMEAMPTLRSKDKGTALGAFGPCEIEYYNDAIEEMKHNLEELFK